MQTRTPYIEHRPLTLRSVAKAFAACLKDERGQAMTEYVYMMLILMTASFWLYHPDNGLYKAMRDRYDRTTTLLMLPGP